jgi:glycine betaine/proline transport system substrate-binding protein
MRLYLKLAVAAFAAIAGSTFVQAAGAAECGTDRKIDIAEMGWPSAAALARIHAIILERGYGCTVELVPGDTVPTLAAMVTKGEPALAPELWPNASKEAWEKGLADGAVVDLGPAIAEGLVQGWYIPTYVAEANPDLKSVEDLPKFAKLFADPDDPGKGRFVSCPPGWACEIMDANFFKAYGLAETFNLFSPGSAGALDATISQAFLRKEPIVFYYWGPTAMMGRFDMTRLEMAPFDEKKFACIGDPACPNPEKTDFIVPDAVKAAASWLPEEAPAVAEYLHKVSLTNAEVGRMLVWGEENKADAQAVADNFLKTEEAIWSKWVPPEVVEAVKASLN